MSKDFSSKISELNSVAACQRLAAAPATGLRSGGVPSELSGREVLYLTNQIILIYITSNRFGLFGEE